jgi:hypothetical protein
MRFRETLVATAALALVGSIAAEAGILASAPAEGYPGTQTLSCNIVSLQTGPKEVTVEALDYDGAVLARDTLILSPGQGYALPSASGYAAWCRFTVGGSPKMYRAVAVYEDGDTYTAAIPAR